MLGQLLADQRWSEALANARPETWELVSRPPEEQKKAGYFDTLREIFQQPSTWLTTGAQMISLIGDLLGILEGIQSLVLTGSGSSEFVGECVRPILRRDLDVVVEVIGGGALLTYGGEALPPRRPAVVVSLARSGDSPESAGAVHRLLESDTEVRHLIVTCNREGRLAREFQRTDSIYGVTLDDATNDRSLVMTSSFTNLLVAVRALGLLPNPERYRALVVELGQIAAQFLRDYLGPIAGLASCGFRRAIFLGSGPRLGAARESALKMLEMTGGSVATLGESFLGLRHGPMSFADDDTVIVCYLSSRPESRAYETDLLREIDEKGLGLSKLIVGEKIPADILRKNDLVFECPGLTDLGDEEVPLLEVIVGQLLAFFRCLHEGLRPDSPSEDGVISRVVPNFKLHIPAG